MKPSSLIPHKKKCLTPSIPRFPPFALHHPQIILVRARKQCHGGGAAAKLGLRQPFFLFSSPANVKLNTRSIRECYLGRHDARIRGIKRVK